MTTKITGLGPSDEPGVGAGTAEAATEADADGDPPVNSALGFKSPGQRAFWIAAAASATLFAEPSDLKKSEGSFTPVAWFGQ